MTIGVGYFGTSNIILGSDMELSGIAKYKGIKDHFAAFAPDGLIASVYAGSEDDMRCVWEEIEDRIETQKNQGASMSVRDVRVILSDSLAAVITDRKSKFQMLVGIAKNNEQPLFLRVLGKRASPAKDWEIIGVGDCELTRYLTSLLNHPNLTNYQAALWASHIISVANSFVQGVGQGIRLTVLMPRGAIQYMDGDIFSKKMDLVDSYVGGAWFDFCNVELSQDDYETKLHAFTTSILAARGGIPLVIRPEI